MEYQQIKKLIDRYFQGETSVEEEQTLRRYFASGKIDERLQEYTPLFRFFALEKEREPEEIPLEGFLDQFRESRSRSLAPNPGRMNWLMKIAAVLLLAAGLWWAYQYQDNVSQTAGVDWSKYEITNEQEALKITRGALFKASENLNRGAAAAAGQMDRVQEIGKFFK